MPVKRVVAARVGYRCSNPACRAATSGPQAGRRKASNIGVAAHITAAAQRGPRFGKALTAEERSGPDNAIWLCQNCAKLIDTDPSRFPVEVLLWWKTDAEAAALEQLGRTAVPAELKELLHDVVWQEREAAKARNSKMVEQTVFREYVRDLTLGDARPTLRLSDDGLSQALAVKVLSVARCPFHGSGVERVTFGDGRGKETPTLIITGCCDEVLEAARRYVLNSIHGLPRVEQTDTAG